MEETSKIKMNPELITTIITGIIASIPGIILALLQHKGQNKEIKIKEALCEIDEKEVISNSYYSLLETLEKRLDKQNKRIAELEVDRKINKKRIENLEHILEAYIKMEKTLRNGVIILSNQLKDLNETPQFVLPKKIELTMIDQESFNGN
jgi:hypothetical protein